MVKINPGPRVLAPQLVALDGTALDNTGAPPVTANYPDYHWPATYDFNGEHFNFDQALTDQHQNSLPGSPYYRRDH